MESKTHKQLKNKSAGKKGTTEKKIKGNKRLDVKVGNKAIEIEKSGNVKKALQRLKSQKNAKKELRVPNSQLDNAKEIAKKMKIKNITIKNLSGTKKRIIKKQ